MIDEPPASGAGIPPGITDASKLAGWFARFVCDIVYRSQAETAKLAYGPTVEQLCRDWSIEDAMNQIFVECGTEVSSYHALPIFSELICWLSGDADLAFNDRGYNDKPEQFGAVVAGNLLHVQSDESWPLTGVIA